MTTARLRTLDGLPIFLPLIAVIACSGEEPQGGAVSGPVDAHCSGQAQVVDLNTCHAMVPPSEPDYGPTLYNSEADDDDCKYHLKFTSTPIRKNEDVTFTVTATTLADGQPAAGADVLAEVFLSETHPAPNSGQATTEKPGGVYDVGPVRFDQSGRWTVRFHLHDECQDSTEDSPHGHVAFYIDVP
jgi:YtkA-like